MKRIALYLFVLGIVIGISFPANSALIDRGADSIGNHLIYDTDLNITWYDSIPFFSGNYQDQMNWAAGLDVTYNGTTFSDWRLPGAVDGPLTYGDNGFQAPVYNITSSEMGHLFYTELGNLGYQDANGNFPQPGFGLTNTGPFNYLGDWWYWSSTEHVDNSSIYLLCWTFDFADGSQYAASAFQMGSAIAVREGDVAAASVPEPETMLLVCSSLVGLVAGRRMFRRNDA